MRLDAQFESIRKDTRELREGIEKLSAEFAVLSVQLAEFDKAVSAMGSNSTLPYWHGAHIATEEAARVAVSTSCNLAGCRGDCGICS